MPQSVQLTLPPGILSEPGVKAALEEVLQATIAMVLAKLAAVRQQQQQPSVN